MLRAVSLRASRGSGGGWGWALNTDLPGQPGNANIGHARSALVLHAMLLVKPATLTGDQSLWSGQGWQADFFIQQTFVAHALHQLAVTQAQAFGYLLEGEAHGGTSRGGCECGSPARWLRFFSQDRVGALVVGGQGERMALSSSIFAVQPP